MISLCSEAEYMFLSPLFKMAPILSGTHARCLLVQTPPTQCLDGCLALFPIPATLAGSPRPPLLSVLLVFPSESLSSSSSWDLYWYSANIAKQQPALTPGTLFPLTPPVCPKCVHPPHLVSRSWLEQQINNFSWSVM